MSGGHRHVVSKSCSSRVSRWIPAVPWGDGLWCYEFHHVTPASAWRLHAGLWKGNGLLLSDGVSWHRTSPRPASTGRPGEEDGASGPRSAHPTSSRRRMSPKSLGHLPHLKLQDQRTVFLFAGPSLRCTPVLHNVIWRGRSIPQTPPPGWTKTFVRGTISKHCHSEKPWVTMVMIDVHAPPCNFTYLLQGSGWGARTGEKCSVSIHFYFLFF